MELKHYLVACWRWAWLIVLATGLAAAISFQVSRGLPPIYSSTTTLMVGSALQAQNPNAADFSTSEQLAQTYSLMVRRQPLLQATADALKLDLPWGALAAQVSATPVPQSQLLQVTVVDSSPQRARAIADELARQIILQSPTPTEKEQDQQQAFVVQQLEQLQARINDAEDQMKGLENQLTLETSARAVQDVQGQIGALLSKISTWQTTYANLLNQKTGRVNSLSVVEPASLPQVPVSPNIPLNVAAAAAIGFVLSIAAILFLEYFDDTLKGSEDVSRDLELLSLGDITRMPSSQRKALVTLTTGHSQIAEAYRVVRTNLQFAMVCTSARTLLVTSAVVGEGKTTTSCNLAVTLAQSGKRVILCDADLRRPAVHKMFGMRGDVGLTNLLLDQSMPPDEALVETAVPGLYVLPSGRRPPNPAELLGSEPMRWRMQELQQLADILLIDGPALLPVADSGILGSLCDGVVLVVDSSRTRRETAKLARQRLDMLGLKIMGVILNQARTRRGADQRYYAYDEESESSPGQPLGSLRNTLLGVATILGHAQPTPNGKTIDALTTRR